MIDGTLDSRNRPRGFLDHSAKSITRNGIEAKLSLLDEDMISECANPSCRIEFVYGRGQFFRFRKAPREDGCPANIHSVQHYWLCHECARSYRLDYEQC